MKKLSLVLAFVLFAAGSILAQRTLTGKVTDTSGEPLIGASVLIKGTSTGTVTDLDGNFELSVPGGSQVLVFSFTGSGYRAGEKVPGLCRTGSGWRRAYDGARPERGFLANG